jgi:lipoate-protein ligase B
MELKMSLPVETWTVESPYKQVSQRQEELISLKQEHLLICEHPSTITLGTRGVVEDLLFPAQHYEDQGIAIFKAPRGGQATYHGPGQLVVYPIINLKKRGIKIRDYLRLLETVMMNVCSHFGIQTHVICGKTGLWVEDRKIGFIGVRVRQGFSFHGFSLNIKPQHDPFRLIVPCGMPNLHVTSMEEETKSQQDVMSVGEIAINHLQNELVNSKEIAGCVSS